MNAAYELAQYLYDSNFGTIGTDIFVDQFPDSANGIMVSNIGGTRNNYIPVSESIVDVYSKNTSASAAIASLEAIRNHIDRMHSTETNNAYIYSMLILGDIEDVLRDQEYAKIYKFTVQLINRDTSLIS